MAPVSTRPEPGTALAVSRWSLPSTVSTVTAALALAVLAVLPYLAGTGITQALVTLFLLVSMAALMGVEVRRTRWLAYVLAALGFGAVGGMLIISTLYIDPATVFNVNYSADMLFMVVIGGLGTGVAGRRGWSLLPVGYRVRAPGRSS
ncbi:MAG TPA: hypothetical protein VMV92_11095 [Streptosporangiaceae bacterium]|nr:hypothetical protein [Streptosporangiaceae bacterium]